MRIVVFGFDVGESSQIRRIRSFIDAGHDVVSLTMRRRNMNNDFRPDWPNVHLFTVPNEMLLFRAAILVLSFFKCLPYLGKLRHADVIVARNLDMLVLAYLARLVSLKWRLPLVYECLDIHGSLTGSGTKSRLLRWAERQMLNRLQLLVISSPGFLEHYFRPYQGYRGPTFLLENKLWLSGVAPARRSSAKNLSNGKPWVIGWVGTLRCEPSFRILLETADRLGSKVKIEMFGIVHSNAIPDFAARISAFPNVHFHGSYAYPDGLRLVYSRCDLVWAQDLWQSGSNSDWLLPNRIYESSYFGCLSIAVHGTETAKKIEREGLGYTIPRAASEDLVHLLEALDPNVVESKRAALMGIAAEHFVASRSEIHAMLNEARGLIAPEE